MDYEYIHDIGPDNVTHAGARRAPKVKAGTYQISVSFPARDLHHHTDSEGCCPPGESIPLECVYAKTSERCIQLDFLGPRGQVRRCVHVEVPDFLEMPETLMRELEHLERSFAESVGCEFSQAMKGIHPGLKPHLEEMIRDEADPARPDPSPVTGMPRDEAIAALKAGRA